MAEDCEDRPTYEDHPTYEEDLRRLEEATNKTEVSSDDEEKSEEMMVFITTTYTYNKGYKHEKQQPDIGSERSYSSRAC